MASEDRLRELEEKYEGYTVYDNSGSKIGKVDDLFVDETDNEEYIGVKMGFFGSKSTLIPTEIVRINENDRTIEVSDSKDHVKDAPSFSDDDDVTSAYEERIRSHFGLESLGTSSGRGSYGGASGTAAAATSGASDRDDHESSDRGSTYETGDSDHESSVYGTRDDEAGSSSSGVDTEYGERRDSDAASAGTAGSAGTTGYHRSGESSSSQGHSEERGGSEETGTQYEDTQSSGVTSSTSGDSSSGSKPATTRQTEETETFQEGGRTKIRRRIIREEVVDADDQDTNS